MSQAEFAVNFFVALFALIDPVGNVPLFAAATAGSKWRDRAWIALYISLFVLAFLTFFYFSGLSLLEFFGISLPAFRIAGGVILFLLGLEMARDDFTATFTEAADSPIITRMLGRIGLTIVVRVLGLILCALAVQFILSGFSDATRGFIRHDAAAPYEKAH